MEALLRLVESAKGDRTKLIALKEMASKCESFEVAEKFREMEKEFFPDTDEVIKEKKHVKQIQLALQMVDLFIAEDICWLILNTLQIQSKIKGKFSLKEAAELIFKRGQLYHGGKE